MEEGGRNGGSGKDRWRVSRRGKEEERRVYTQNIILRRTRREITASSCHSVDIGREENFANRYPPRLLLLLSYIMLVSRTQTVLAYFPTTG